MPVEGSSQGDAAIVKETAATVNETVPSDAVLTDERVPVRFPTLLKQKRVLVERRESRVNTVAKQSSFRVSFLKSQLLLASKDQSKEQAQQSKLDTATSVPELKKPYLEQKELLRERTAAFSDHKKRASDNYDIYVIKKGLKEKDKQERKAFKEELKRLRKLQKQQKKEEEKEKKRELKEQRKNKDKSKRNSKNLDQADSTNSLYTPSPVDVSAETPAKEEPKPDESQAPDTAKDTLDNVRKILPLQLIVKILSLLPLQSLVAISETSKEWKRLVEEAPVWSSLSLKEYLEKKYIEEQRRFWTYANEPQFEVERTLCIITMMAYLEKLHKRDLYSSKLNSLLELHLSLGNNVEAALCVLLQADEYSWSDRPQVLSPTRQSSSRHLQIDKEAGSVTKERLYYKAIELFSNGKYWELGISLLHELRKVQTILRTPDEILDLERQFYLNIKSKERFFEQYFLVEFIGKGFPHPYKGRQFVYRGTELERLGNFIIRLKQRFPEAEVLHSDASPSQVEGDKQYLRIRTCKPSCMEETEGKQKILPTHLPSVIKRFHRNTNINVFTFSTTFKKQTDSVNDVSNLWIKNTFVIVKDTFPTIHRSSCVTELIEVELSPIDSSIKVIQEKNEELLTITEQTELSQTWKSPFTMALKGCIDAAVNGGTEKYNTAFFSEEFIKQATDKERLSIPKLQQALLQQIDILEKALQVHKKFCPQNMFALHSQLQSQFEVMKTRTLSIDKSLNLKRFFNAEN